jgi:hypothetical protein
MLFGNLLPGADERAGDHRRPEEEVEAAGDASRRAFKDARPCPRREREDGVHEPSRADVLFLLLMVGGGYVAVWPRGRRVCMVGEVRRKGRELVRGNLRLKSTNAYPSPKILHYLRQKK